MHSYGFLHKYVSWRLSPQAAHPMNMASTVLECVPVRTVLHAHQLMERVHALLVTMVQTAVNVSSSCQFEVLNL